MKKNSFNSLIAVLLVVFGSSILNAQTISKKLKWSERMAETVMLQHKESYMIDHANFSKMGLRSRIGVDCNGRIE